MPITDVQWVLGHQSLTTTQIYVVPTAEDVIEATLASPPAGRPRPQPAPARGRDTGRRAWTCCSEGPLVTAVELAGADARPWQLSAEALAVMEKFPPRPVPVLGPDGGDRSAVVGGCSPGRSCRDAKTRHSRKLALVKVLDWLELYPGATWQERWEATGAGSDGTRLATGCWTA